MEVNEVLNGISSVGFPIVMCVMLYYFNKVEIEKLRETIENNSKIIAELKEVIKDIDDRRYKIG